MIACKDCKHFWNTITGPECHNPACAVNDPIWGKTEKRNARIVRDFGDLCGPQAKYFEAAE